MAKKVTGQIKLQIPGGQASPAQVIEDLLLVLVTEPAGVQAQRPLHQSFTRAAVSPSHDLRPGKQSECMRVA